MELRDYLVLVVRNWLIIAVTVAVGLVAAGVMIAVATPMYESKARVVFTAHDVASGQDLAYAGNYVQSRMQTYKQAPATSESVMKTVVGSLGGGESTTHLAHRTSVEVSQIDTIISIAVKDESAKGAAEAANAVATSLIQTVTSLESDHQKVAGSHRRGRDHRPRDAIVFAGKSEQAALPAGRTPGGAAGQRHRGLGPGGVPRRGPTCGRRGPGRFMTDGPPVPALGSHLRKAIEASGWMYSSRALVFGWALLLTHQFGIGEYGIYAMAFAAGSLIGVPIDSVLHRPGATCGQ